MRVLLATDGSSAADALVDTVARQFKDSATEVRVLNVIDWGREYPAPLSFVQGTNAGEHVVDVRDSTRRRSVDAVDHAVRRLRAAGLTVSSEIREGEPGPLILDVAAEWHPDTIVLGSHGRHGWDRIVAGSVAEFVLRHARCGVEIVRPPLASA